MPSILSKYKFPTQATPEEKAALQQQEPKRDDRTDPAYAHPGFHGNNAEQPAVKKDDTSAADLAKTNDAPVDGEKKTNGAKYGKGRFFKELVPSMRGI